MNLFKALIETNHEFKFRLFIKANTNRSYFSPISVFSLAMHPNQELSLVDTLSVMLNMSINHDWRKAFLDELEDRAFVAT